MGLTIHRVLQYVGTVAVTVTAAVIISIRDDWGKLKDNAIRMESVPGDVRDIKVELRANALRQENHEIRISELELSKKRR